MDWEMFALEHLSLSGDLIEVYNFARDVVRWTVSLFPRIGELKLEEIDLRYERGDLKMT